MVSRRLVGRGLELGQLAAWVADVAAGRGRAVLVEGEPGIGKSTLLQAVADQAEPAGCAVFWGAAEELTQAFPLQPLLRAFAIGSSAPGPRRTAVFDVLHD